MQSRSPAWCRPPRRVPPPDAQAKSPLAPRAPKPPVRKIHAKQERSTRGKLAWRECSTRGKRAWRECSTRGKRAWRECSTQSRSPAWCRPPAQRAPPRATRPPLAPLWVGTVGFMPNWLGCRWVPGGLDYTAGLEIVRLPLPQLLCQRFSNVRSP